MFFVNGTRYDLAALNDPAGRYGRWNWPVIATYCCGVLMALPFISSGFYTGPVARALNYADVSWVVGLLGTGMLYCLVSRRMAARVPPSLTPALDSKA